MAVRHQRGFDVVDDVSLGGLRPVLGRLRQMGQTLTGAAVFAAQALDHDGYRLMFLDRAHALTSGPDVLPFLGSDGLVAIVITARRGGQVVRISGRWHAAKV